MNWNRAAVGWLALAIAGGAFWASSAGSTPAAPHPAAGAETFVLPGLDGTPHRLADWHGKVIVLNFWASWCAACQVEIRDFVAYQERHAADGLQIVGIGVDDARPLRNVQRSLAINYPVLVADPLREFGILRSWGDSSGAIPYTVVIDRSARVVHQHRGPMTYEQIEEIITPLLDQQR